MSSTGSKRSKIKELEKDRVGGEGMVTVTVPMLRTTLPVSLRVDTSLQRHQAQALRDLLDGLTDGGARLENSQPIRSQTDALRWLLERLAVGQLQAVHDADARVF